jgi:hypothetical protein
MSELKKFQLSKIDFKMASFPIFSEVLNKSPWVFYGANNLLPQYFISLYDNCAIHKAIVKSKVNQILGDGIFSKDNPDAVWSLINEDENITDVMRKAALDFMLFGGFALNIVWSKDRKTIADIYHLDFSRVRSGKVNTDTDKVDHYYYSPVWEDTRKFPPQEFKAFNKNEKDPVQIFYFKIYQPGLTYYPVPDWSAGQRSIEIDIEIKNFHMNNLRQGMVPSLWINYNNGIPGEEEQRVLVRALESQYGGTDNAGQAIISFNESKEQSPDIVQIPRNDHDSYYQSLYEDISRSILSSHRVSSAELFGISTPGKLGSRNEIIDHSEYFRKMVIMPYQEEVLPVFNKLLSLFFGKKTTLEITPLSIYAIGNTVQEGPQTDGTPEVSQTSPSGTNEEKQQPTIKTGPNEQNRPQGNYPNLNN